MPEMQSHGQGYRCCEPHLGVNTDLNEAEILLAHAAVT